MDISIIGVPIFYGADKQGPEFGPAKRAGRSSIETLPFGVSR